MKYITEIATGFSIELNEETGEYNGVSHNNHNERHFSGNINTMTYEDKIHMEAKLDDGILDKHAKKFWDAMDTMMPGFHGFC